MTACKALLIVSSFVVAAAVMTGCLGPGSAPGGSAEGGGGQIPISTVLFSEDPVSGAVTLTTNDATHVGPKGKTFWHMGTVTQTTMDEYEVELYKLGGRAEMGYGLTFAMQDIQNFLTVLITTNRFYIVGKVVDGSFEAITGSGTWVFSGDLLQGYNRRNSLRIRYDATEEQFRLWINDEEQDPFVDNGEPAFEGGGFGHIVTLSPLETFPELPVHAVFETQVPSDIGIVPFVGEDGMAPVGRPALPASRNRFAVDESFGSLGR